MVPVQKVDVGRGVGWIGDGFRNFMKSPGMWILLGVVFFVMYLVVSLIPFLGALIAALLSPALTGGLMFAAKQADAGQSIEFGYLFRGFKESRALNGLLALGGIVVAGTIASMIVMFMSGGAFMAGMHGGGPGAFMFGPAVLLALLLVLAIQLAVAIVVVYAIPLVMLKSTPPGEAMSASINACITNFVPLLVFGAVYLIVAILAALPFGLGFLVLLPASFGMLYVSYRDIFGT